MKTQKILGVIQANELGMWFKTSGGFFSTTTVIHYCGDDFSPFIF
jgi:hypothetical protein